MFDHGKIRGELAISNVELSPQSKVKWNRAAVSIREIALPDAPTP
jgi:hypothetical protein